MPKPKQLTISGFSLVELLITLAIMGVLAACTIPPLFQMPASSQANKWSAITKDTAFMVLAAYQQYQSANSTVATTVSMTNLSPYMNYLSIDTSNYIDNPSDSASPSVQCAASRPCLVLHNGGKLYLDSAQFGGTTTTNQIQAYMDPDGIVTAPSSTAQTAPKSVQIVLYYDGTIKTLGTARNPSYNNSWGSWAPDSLGDPSWFSGF